MRASRDRSPSRPTAGDLFRLAVERNRMVEPGQGVLAAVSGGGDSVLMLHLLAELRASVPFTLAVAHLNHGLRGREADEDEIFVRALARRLSLPLTVGSADLRRKPGEPSSEEERAREARRSFLREAARKSGSDRIALGHTLDDQAETILMWLLRGTGRGGLAGMEPVTEEGIIRPLIRVRRSEVRDHLRRMGEAFRDDVTNEDTSRTRNRVRLRLVPSIDRDFPGGIERMAAAAETLGGEEALLDGLAKALVGPDGSLAAASLSDPDARRLAGRAVRLAAGRSGMDPRLLMRDHIEAILELAAGGAEGRGVDLPGGFRAVRRGASVLFAPRERSGPRRR